MIRDQIALIRRELWEHRSLFVTPAVLALLASLGTITGQVSISAFDQMIDMGMGKNKCNMKRFLRLLFMFQYFRNQFPA